MNKPDLITKMAHDYNCTKIEAKRVIERFTVTVFDALMHGETVSISGFGTWKVIETPEHTYYHPGTGTMEKAEARGHIKFTPSSLMAEVVK